MSSSSSPLTVLYLINGLGTGGAERSLAEMLEPISRYGIKILPVCLYPREEGVQSDVINAGYEVRDWFFYGMGLSPVP